MGVNNSLGEASGSRSEEENGLGVGLGRGKLEILGAFLSLGGLLDIVKQLDVQASCAGLVELTRSNLVGQPDGLDRVGSQEGVEVLNVSLAVVELGGEIGKEARDEASTDGRPDGQHVILMGRQVDDNDRLLAGRRGANGSRTERGHECVGHGLDGGLKPRNIVDLDSGRRGDEGERPVPVDLSGPREHVGKCTQVR